MDMHLFVHVHEFIQAYSLKHLLEEHFYSLDLNKSSQLLYPVSFFHTLSMKKKFPFL